MQARWMRAGRIGVLVLLFGMGVLSGWSRDRPERAREVSAVEPVGGPSALAPPRADAAAALQVRVMTRTGERAAEGGGYGPGPATGGEGEAPAAAGRIRPRETQASVSQGYAWPVTGRITSGFGPRDSGWHGGIDIAVAARTPLKAARAGVVKAVGPMGDYGLAVILEHPDESMTLYAHASELLVEEGQSVARGEVIALAGSTGYSTGPHLHFEVLVDGKQHDPLQHLPPR